MGIIFILIFIIGICIGMIIGSPESYKDKKLLKIYRELNQKKIDAIQHDINKALASGGGFVKIPSGTIVIE